MQPLSSPDRYEPISVPEAASRLGVSESTVRRMIREGKLLAEREARPQGELVRVLWPRSEDVSPTSQPPVSAPSEPPVIDLSAAITPLTEQIADLIARNTAQGERVAALERENGRLEAEATHAAEAARIERERRQEAEAELQRLRARRWWQWW